MRSFTKTASPAESLELRKSVTADGCWEWTGANNGSGYGAMYDHRTGGMAYPHRVSYELNVGPIPVGMVIDHICFNRLCFNPDHLQAITQSENRLRSSAVGRKRKRLTHCQNGHPFTNENVIWDRKRERRTCKLCNQRRRALIKAGIRVRTGEINHGTLGAYQHHGCRCDACRQARAERERFVRRSMLPGATPRSAA